MEEYWEVGPVDATEHTVHLAKAGNHAECKPYTKNDLVLVIARVNAPGYGNALIARMRDAHLEPNQLCTDGCFPPEFRGIYAQLISEIKQRAAAL